MLLINGVPVVQIELKTLAVSLRRAMQQIVDYKTGSRQWLQQNAAVLHQLFIVSNRIPGTSPTTTHGTSAFNAKRFLPVYQFASEDIRKSLLDRFAEVPGQVYLGK
jgi:type I restriction enzyme R subunit